MRPITHFACIEVAVRDTNPGRIQVAPGRIDLPTLIAIALVAYAITNVSHEGLGHGGACALVGGKPAGINAVYFDCDESMLGPAAIKWISAAGTVVNLVFAVNLGETVRLHRRKAVLAHVSERGAGLMMQGRTQLRPTA